MTSEVLTPSNPAKPVAGSFSSGIVSFEALDTAATTLDGELSLTSLDPPQARDTSFASAYLNAQGYRGSIRGKWTKQEHAIYTWRIRGLIDGLRWRYRIQEPFYLMLDYLVCRDLLQPGTLQAGIDWDHTSPELESLVQVLGCFKIGQDCREVIHEDPEGRFESLRDYFEAPVYWLAHVILRAATDLPSILENLNTSGLLGVFDAAKAAKINSNDWENYSMPHGTFADLIHCFCFNLFTP